jgi:hypothetical protein
VAKRIFATFGDADCKVGFLVTADEEVTRRVLGDAEETVFTLTDPECELVQSLGLRQLPAHVARRRRRGLGSGRLAAGGPLDRQGPGLDDARGQRPR